MPGTFKVKWLNRLNTESNRGAGASTASLAVSLWLDPASWLDGCLGKDRGKPPGVHDPTHTRTPEGYVPLGGYPGVGQEECYAKVHPHKVVPQHLPPHSLHAARVVVARHLRCTQTQQQWGLPRVPLVGLTALTR